MASERTAADGLSGGIDGTAEQRWAGGLRSLLSGSARRARSGLRDWAEHPERIVAAWIVIASALHFLGGNVADPDLWGHLRYGAMMLGPEGFPHTDTFSYSAHGAPFYDHEWLSDLVFAALYAVAGTGALVALKLGLGAVMLLAMVDGARSTARFAGLAGALHPLTLAGVLIASLAVISPGASFRPQLFTMAFLAFEGALLARADLRLESAPSGRRIGAELIALPPLVMVWANLHGGFLVGIGMLGMYGIAVAARWAWPEGLWSDRVALARRDVLGVAAVCLAAVLAPLVNPYGIELYRYLFDTLDMHGEISEWYPVLLLSHEFLRFKLLVLVSFAGVAWLAVRAQRRPRTAAALDWRTAMLAFACVYAFRHQRHTVLFAIVAAPLLAWAAEEARRALLVRWPQLRPRRPVAISIALGACAVALLQVGWFASAMHRDGLGIRFGRLDYPVDAVEFLRRYDIKGNIAMPFEWGAYSIYKLAPRSRVFIDGRFEAVYPQRVIDDYFAFMHGTEGWERLLDEYPTDVVVVQRWRNIHPRMFGRSDFAYVYSDPAALVFVRRSPANAAALARLDTYIANRHGFTPPETVFP